MEAQRISLIEGITSNKKKMLELENNLLFKLTSIQGSLLEEESLIETLNVTKKTAIDVSEKISNAQETEAKINLAREEFRPSKFKQQSPKNSFLIIFFFNSKLLLGEVFYSS